MRENSHKYEEKFSWKIIWGSCIYEILLLPLECENGGVSKVPGGIDDTGDSKFAVCRAKNVLLSYITHIISLFLLGTSLYREISFSDYSIHAPKAKKSLKRWIIGLSIFKVFAKTKNPCQHR